MFGRRSERSVGLSVGMVSLLVLPMLVLPAQPALASHFIAVEPRVDIIYGDAGGTFDGHPVTYAVNVRLRLDSRWVGSGSFSSLTLRNPDGNIITPPQTNIVSITNAPTGLTIINYDFSSIDGVGVYVLSAGPQCCDKTFVNSTSSGQFSFDVGFWFDKDDPAASQGSPRFNAALITNIAGGTTFSQNLGGQSVNPGGTVSLSLIEDADTSGAAGAPVTLAGLKPPDGTGAAQAGPAIDWTSTSLGAVDLLQLDGQTLTIPGAISAAIVEDSALTNSLKVKLRLEESVGEETRGFLTRTIGFEFKDSDNVAPEISLAAGGVAISGGDILTVPQGSSVVLTVTASDANVDTDGDPRDEVTLGFTSLPAWATASEQTGTNPATRTLTLNPTAANSVAGDRTLEITATDDDSFSLTTSFSFVVRITTDPLALPTPPQPAPSGPSPVTEPDGGVPVVAPGGSSGSVGGVPVVPTPSRPSGGSAEFRVGTVETRVDVASSGAGAVAGSDGAPVIRAVRDRVATVSGGGMRPGGIAEVWMPLPNGGSRQVALLPIAADGTFDGALPFTGELDGRGPLPIGDRTIQLFGRAADGQLTVINFGVRIEQPAPIAPEPDRGRGAVPTLAPGQSLATNAGLPTPVTVTPLPEARSTRIEGDGWLMDVDVPDGEVLDDGGAPLIEIVNGTDSRVRGTGFMAGTRAYVWLMSDPTFLGEVTVNADGSFSGSVPIAGVEPGEHTLQLSGVGSDGFVRAANLGVVLVGDGTPVPRRIDAGGGPVPLVPLSMLLVVALLGAVALTTERGRALAATGAAEHSARLDAHARHRLPAFDALQQRLTEQRRALRSRD